MIRPLQAGDALLDDVRGADADPGLLHLWWLGQAGFLVAWEGRHLLLDPYLSDSLTRKYADTDKPHERMTELVVEPERLGLVDVVTSSHAHTDHLDPDTLRALVAARPDVEIVAPEAHRDLVAERAGVARERPLGLDDGETVDAGGFSFTAVPAAHEEIERDAQGRMRCLGYVVRCGPFALYHAGDTIAYDGMAERVRAAAGRRRDRRRAAADQRPRAGAAGGRQPVGRRGGGGGARRRRARGGPDALRAVRVQHRAARRVRRGLHAARPAAPRAAGGRALTVAQPE